MFRLMNQFCCFCGHRIEFLVHHMIFDHIHMNRTKCTKPNMEGNKAELNPLSPQLFHELFCEVKPGCRRSCRPLNPTVDRLIALVIFQFLMNIRRKRYIAQTIQNLLKDAIINKFYNSTAKVRMGNNLTGQLLTKMYDRANTNFFSRFYKGFPLVSVNLA